MMREGEYYSVQDLANLTDQQRNTVIDVVSFLSKYGFVKSIGAYELFTKSTVTVSPEESVNLLRCIANG